MRALFLFHFSLMKKLIHQEYGFTKMLLWIGALFFAAEFFLHFFGIEPLEHDKIFIPTHDRYIAAYALTMAGLAVITSTDFKKYRELFFFTMAMMGLGIMIASIIAFEGGYSPLFPVVTLDDQLSTLGVLFIAWYAVTWISWWKKY